MPIGFHHLFGARTWARCDHAGTRLHAPTETLRLATREAVDAGADVDLAPWRAARTGAVALPVDPAACAEATEGWRLGLPGEGLGRWRAGWALAAPVAGLRSVAGVACGRWWALAEGRVCSFSATTGEAREEGPAPADAEQLAVTPDGLYAVGAGRAWFGAFDGTWRPVALPATARAVAARGEEAAILTDEPALYRVRAGTVREGGPIDLDDPLPLLVLPDGGVLVGELTGPPPRRTLFTTFRWTGGVPNADDTREVAGFDGRGLLADDAGVAWASTARGWRRLYRVSPELVTEGVIETFALDSERYGCVWHRVFLDVCLPAGTSVSVSARASDELWPTLAVPGPRPRPAQGATADPEGVHLGSRDAADEEGWVEVGTLDRVPLRADLPAPFRGELPALDPLPRGALATPAAAETLEGLLKNPGGRYLWLRVRLRGTRKATPVLAGVRAWSPRPSLLAFLPSFWRADADAARRMDALLALFESPLTRIEQRVDALPALFDPRAAPPEALDWLASFVGLAFDGRVREGVRRALLAEIVPLWHRRGTVGALERIGTILAEAEVRVVEAWRLRAAHGAVLGVDGDLAAVVGPGLELGGELPPDPASDGADAVRAFHRRTAHRFAVVVYAPCTPELEAVLARAIELEKPAHTVHTLCWMDGGMRLGSRAVLGVSTLPGPAPEPPAATVGRDPLGAARVSRAGADVLPLRPPSLPESDA